MPINVRPRRNYPHTVISVCPSFVHELLHTTRKGDDHEAIAREIAGLEGIGTQLKSYLKGRSNVDLESSAFINSWLNENCDIKAEGVKSWQEVLEVIGVN